MLLEVELDGSFVFKFLTKHPAVPPTRCFVELIPFALKLEPKTPIRLEALRGNQCFQQPIMLDVPEKDSQKKKQIPHFS